MKKAEVESFVEIADEYFKHLRKAFDQNVNLIRSVTQLCMQYYS